MFKIAHLTDLHLTAARQLLYGAIDPWTRAKLALDLAAAEQPDLIVVTGDICDRSAPNYEAAGEMLAGTAVRARKPLLLLPGNHDAPWALPETIIGADFLPAQSEISYGVCPGDAVITTSSWQIVGLNSHGQQQPSGELLAAQMQWLKAVLRPSKPALLALHHPPLPHPLPQLRDIGLADPARLRQAITQRRHPAALQTMGIISGHFHFPLQANLGEAPRSLPVWVGPSVTYGIDPKAEPGILRAIDYTGYQVLRGDNSRMLAQLRITGETATEIYRKPLNTQERV